MIVLKSFNWNDYYLIANRVNLFAAIQQCNVHNCVGQWYHVVEYLCFVCDVHVPFDLFGELQVAFRYFVQLAVGLEPMSNKNSGATFKWCAQYIHVRNNFTIPTLYTHTKTTTFLFKRPVLKTQSIIKFVALLRKEYTNILLLMVELSRFVASTSSDRIVKQINTALPLIVTSFNYSTIITIRSIKIGQGCILTSHNIYIAKRTYCR